jgi:hypothetical protein
MAIRPRPCPGPRFRQEPRFRPFWEREAITGNGAIAIALRNNGAIAIALRNNGAIAIALRKNGASAIALRNNGAISIAPFDFYDLVNVVGHYDEFINDAFFSYNGNVFDFVFHDTSVFG